MLDRDFDALAIEVRAHAHHLLERASHAYVQLLDVYDVCKDDPSLLWNDNDIRQLIIPPTVALFSLIATSIIYLLATSRYRKERASQAVAEEKDKKRAILQKLLAVLTPTRSKWTNAYWDLAQKSIKTLDFRIPAPTLVEDLVKGEVELRDATVQLPGLIMGSLEAEGLPVRLEAPASLYARVMKASAETRSTRTVRM